MRLCARNIFKEKGSKNGSTFVSARLRAKINTVLISAFHKLEFCNKMILIHNNLINKYFFLYTLIQNRTFITGQDRVYNMSYFLDSFHILDSGSTQLCICYFSNWSIVGS